MRVTITIVIALLIIVPVLLPASDFQCVLGEEVSSNLGEGVILRTCMLNKTPGVFIRTGPLELEKNGILILQSQTDNDGKLHGQFTSWNDAGEITERGHYVRGLKEGAWMVTNKNGKSETLLYNGGTLVNP